MQLSMYASTSRIYNTAHAIHISDSFFYSKHTLVTVKHGFVRKRIILFESLDNALGKKATVHQITTRLATSKNVLFPSPNHLVITGTDGPSLAGTQAIIKVLSHQYQWLAGG